MTAPQTLNVSDILKTLRMAVAPGNFFTISKLLFSIMGYDEVVLLSYLWGVCRAVEKDGDWFYCTVERIETEINMNQDTQKRILGKLIEHGWIERKQNGVRFVRIREEAIAVALTTQCAGSGGNARPGRAFPHDPLVSISKVQEQTAPTGVAGTEPSCGGNITATHHKESNMGLMPQYDTITSTPQTEDTARATNFFNALKAKGKIAGATSIKTWANAFRLLREKDNIPGERIDRVCAWYIEHIAAPYVPVAYSAGTFRTKFIAIETAMQRAAPPPPKEISRSAVLMRERLGIIWTGNVRQEDFDAAMQASLDEIAWIAKALKQIKDPRLAGAADCIWHELGPTFIERWWRDLATWHHAKQIPMVNIMKWAVRLGNDKFQAKCQEAVKRYGAEDSTWPRILEILQRANPAV